MSETLAPLVLLLGDDVLARKDAEDAWRKQVFGDANPSFNLAVLSAADGAERAIEVAKTMPMMAPHRLVVIRDIDEAPVSLLDDLMAYAERPSPSTTLLLTGRKLPPAQGGVDRGRKLEARVKKMGEVHRFKTAQRDPVRFALDHSSSLGCPLDWRAAQLLVQLVGQDLGQIKNETEKVVAYVGEGDGAGIQDVEAVCCVVAEAVIWDLTDAIVSRNANVALSVAHRMLEMGESPHRLLAMVNWQMRQLITLQACMHTGRSTRDAGLKMPGRKMDAARNMLQRRPIDAPRLLADLATANQGFNSSRAGDRRVFEGLLLRLTAGR